TTSASYTVPTRRSSDLDSTDQSTAWGPDFQNAYAAAAFSLKQYDYRRAVGLPLALSLPGLLADSIDKTVGLPVYVRDSLYKAPVDRKSTRLNSRWISYA